MPLASVAVERGEELASEFYLKPAGEIAAVPLRAESLPLARPEGLEPPACWFEASRSIPLSYGRGLTHYSLGGSAGR